MVIMFTAGAMFGMLCAGFILSLDEERKSSPKENSESKIFDWTKHGECPGK